MSIDKNIKKENELVQLIAKRIKQIRDTKNITQESFYNDTNIHIARIETGRTNITINTLYTICKYFGISLSDFFKDLEEVEKKSL